MKLIEIKKIKKVIKDYWIEQVSKISDLNLDFDEYQEHINNYIKYNYDLILLINNLPYSYSERKKGTWTKDASCPFCGFQPWYEKDIHTLSFCPHCGADLKGEENALN